MAEESGRRPNVGVPDDVAGSSSRRQFLAAAGAAGVALAAGGYASARQGNLIELGAAASGWEGRTPSAIEGETNPTLPLEAGRTYEVAWVNLDGLPHNLVIENADGGRLLRTKRKSKAGAIQRVTVTASREMAGYYCEVHPDSMAGRIDVAAATPTATPTPTPTPEPPDVAGKTFVAALAGENEVPPVDTGATGRARFAVERRGGGLAVRYRLAVSCPWNGCVTAAHVHLGGPGATGPPVATLFEADQPVPRAEGVLAEGVLTGADLTGPLAGSDAATLAARMDAGATYVDVHTTAHPEGEIRGRPDPVGGS